jgi:thymidylate kinase
MANSAAAPRLVVILGPDGSGKTTVAEGVAAALRSVGVPAERVYMGAGTPGLPTRRLRQALRRRRPGGPRLLDAGRPHRVAELAHTWADFVWRDRTQLQPRLRHGATVLCDRYAYDMATWNVPRLPERRLLWLLLRLVRRPHRTIVLEAPAETIRERRDELSVAEIHRQHRRLAMLAERMPGAVRLDASGSPDEVIAAAVGAVLSA